MNYIVRITDQLIDRHLRNGLHAGDKLLEKVQDELYNIRSDKDKIKILTSILEANDQEYTEHLKVCNNLNSCSTNQEHEKISYFLGQELDDLGIIMDEDAFTRQEKADTNEMLSQILEELQDLKDGQQVMYDDITAEIEELKRWYILGKKNWKQLFVAKFGEMVTAGVIGEATAKPILDYLGELPTLLNG